MTLPQFTPPLGVPLEEIHGKCRACGLLAQLDNDSELCRACFRIVVLLPAVLRGDNEKDRGERWAHVPGAVSK